MEVDTKLKQVDTKLKVLGVFLFLVTVLAIILAFYVSWSDKLNVTTINATTTLSPTQSQDIFSLVMTTSAIVVTLPAVASSTGVVYTFLLKTVNSSGTVTISSADGAGTMLGTIIRNNGSSNSYASSSTNVLITGSATPIAGDTATLYCDGTTWTCLGVSADANSWAFS